MLLLPHKKKKTMSQLTPLVQGTRLQSSQSSQSNQLSTSRSTYSKKHKKRLRDNIQDITKFDFRRMARRGGVKRMSDLIYGESRGVLKVFLEHIIRDSITMAIHSRRNTVMLKDVLYTLKNQKRTLYF